MALDLTYQKRLETRKIEPNFFTAEEYQKRAGAKEVNQDIHGSVSGVTRILLDGGDLLPPLFKWDKGPRVCWLDWEVFADFPQHTYGVGVDLEKQFLDYQYIYDPRAFLDLKGKKWRTFRKNSRKWIEGKRGVDYKTTLEDPPESEVIDHLVGSWLDSFPEGAEFYDLDVLLDYARNGYHRGFLFHDDELVGMNIWDYNWKYINYRFCICLPEKFLSEFLRLTFYTSREILEDGRMVNDGGTLGSETLKFFKDRMNPILVEKIYSWRRTG